MHDDIATTTGNSQESDRPDITDLGHGVFQIDTKMAGYEGIDEGALYHDVAAPDIVKIAAARHRREYSGVDHAASRGRSRQAHDKMVGLPRQFREHRLLVATPLLDAAPAELAFLVPQKRQLFRGRQHFLPINIIELEADVLDFVFD